MLDTTATHERPGRRTSTRGLRDLEGREVSLALTDGSRLDAVTLVSAGRGRTPSVWIHTGGMDVFVPRPTIVDAWESPPPRAA